MNAKRRINTRGPIVREVKRLPAESFTLFDSANVSPLKSSGRVLRQSEMKPHVQGSDALFHVSRTDNSRS